MYGAGFIRPVVDAWVAPGWTLDASESCQTLLAAMGRALKTKTSILDKKLAMLGSDNREEARWIQARLMDDKLFLAEGACKVASIQAEKSGPQEKAQAALRAMRDFGIHRWTVRNEHAALIKALDAKPGLRVALSETSGNALRSIAAGAQGLWGRRFGRS